MKVKELIKKLEKIDQEAEIYFLNDDHYYGKSNSKITGILKDTEDSFELFSEEELKRYKHLSSKSNINIIDKEKRMNEKIKDIEKNIMLSDYAKKIEKNKIYKIYDYNQIQEDKAKWNKQEVELNALEKKIVKKGIIVLK